MMLPPTVWDVCMRDVLALSFCLMNCLVLAKKKKISAHSKECIIRLVKMGRIISGRTNNGLRLALFQA